MAANDPVFGTRTVLANISRINSEASGSACAFGEVDNATSPKGDYLIHIVIPLTSSNTSGTVDLYMVESQDGTEWTDNIDPSGSDSDWSDFLDDARFVRSANGIYDNSPTGARTEVEFHFKVSEVCGWPAPPYFGFVIKNSTNAAFGSSGSDGDSMSISIASS